MIVVSNTSPLSNLIQIGQVELLHSLYQEIIIPSSVASELSRIRNHQRILKKTKWIKVEQVKDVTSVERLFSILDYGEAEAIVLAEEHGADLLLIDELAGRKIARIQGIKYTGALGILLKAKKTGLIPEVRSCLEQLRSDAGFWIRPSLYEEVLRIAGELE